VILAAAVAGHWLRCDEWRKETHERQALAHDRSATLHADWEAIALRTGSLDGTMPLPSEPFAKTP
jgi:hypothetical protein